MNNHTKEFLTKLASLLEEYNAEAEIDQSDRYGCSGLELTVKNPKTFDEHYEEWTTEHPDQKYPLNGPSLYDWVDYVNVGSMFNGEDIRGLVK